MLNSVVENKELQLAHDFVQYTDRNIFLTGKAGTGKTTFLHSLRKNTAKRLIVTAPTGVAAINAGGVTLHSFFQLPFGPYIPGSDYEQGNRRQYRFSNEKKAIIKSLDLLVIDEISMVRADLLDAVDATLRRHRRNNLPFGGVQLLMIGDLHQLSPVAKGDEWRLLQKYYDSVYFFSSQALRQTELITIELRHIYRQSDAHFIEILNRVRDNCLDEQAKDALNDRYIPDFSSDDDYITLTTHNDRADSINRDRLHDLSNKEKTYSAEISGDFTEHTYPAPAALKLKKGAQVMFLKNDPEPEKRYYNGKIGVVTDLTSKTISVLCTGDSKELNVERQEWQNIKYTVNEESREIAEKIIGTFTQFPLKLAWAITIHKSQGLTFAKVIIDAQAAFAHGQVYVALSRCKTLEGIVLRTPISEQGVATDNEVLAFDAEARQNPPQEDELSQAQIVYQQKMLLACFNFESLRSQFGYFMHLIQGNSRLIHLTGLADLNDLQARAAKDVFTVANNFCRQLTSIFAAGNLPESDDLVLERIGKASIWFQKKFNDIFAEFEESVRVETDNAELRKKINRALNNLRQEIAVQRAGIGSCQNGFSTAAYLRDITKAELDFIPQKVKKTPALAYTESDVAHPELFKTLSDWRDKQAKEEGVPHFQIMHQQVLIQIVVYLPENMATLRKIPGVGPKTIGEYGNALVEIVVNYRRKKGIVKVERPKPAVVAVPQSTRDISLNMLEGGMTVPEIAKERGLVESTIESHLSACIQEGSLDINKLLSREQQKDIEQVLAKLQTDSLSEVKAALGDKYSYGQIKMVLARPKK